MSKIDRAAKLRELLRTKESVYGPAVYDPLTVRMAENAGFELVLVSGSSMACTSLGMSDIGVLSYGEYRNTLQNMLNVSTIPMIADIDTGFGGPVTIYRAIREYEDMGIAGVMLEDQTFPKRCAYYDGLTVVETEEMHVRIQSALKARTDPNFFILARTDAAADKSKGMEEALRRAELYHAWGADGVYISTPKNEQDLIRIGKLDFPTAVCITEGSATGTYTAEDLKQKGIQMVFFPQSLTRCCIHAMEKVLREMKQKGTTRHLEDTFCTQEVRAGNTGLERFTDFEAEVYRSLELGN